jgi:hypothetical protein
MGLVQEIDSIVSLSADKAGEFSRITVEAREDGIQVGNADVLAEDFAEHGAKVGGEG